MKHSMSRRKGPNMRMDLPVTVAAQRVLRPRCLLVVPAAHAPVGRSPIIAGAHAWHIT